VYISDFRQFTSLRVAEINVADFSHLGPKKLLEKNLALSAVFLILRYRDYASSSQLQLSFVKWLNFPLQNPQHFRLWNGGH
jgi:hypothetical protein